MKIISKIYKFLFLIACICVFGDANAKIFDMHEFTLKNGLRVIVVPNHKAPIIMHMVWYKVGSVDEVLGKSGKAHLLEHLLFRGTKQIKDSEFNKIIDENGGNSNAFTGLDFTAYHQSLDITRLEVAMFLEADRMENLKFSKESFERERDIVFQERKQVIDNNPLGYFGELSRSMLWGNHPYGRPIIGSDEEIKSFEINDVKSFYNSFYAPNNAILVLSGDITLEEAKLLSERYYSRPEYREIGQRPDIKPIDKPFSAKLNIEVPNINSTRFNKFYVTHSYNTNKKKMYALSVLSKILGEGENSKLYKDLVKDKKIALTVSSYYNGFTRSYGSFAISAIPNLNQDINVFTKEFEISLKKSVFELSEEDVENAKKKMLAGLVYVKDNPNDAGYIVGTMATIGMSVDEIENYDENIRGVSFEDVREAAEELFDEHLTQNILSIATPKKGEGNE